MAERFELSELGDVATFLELIEDGGTTAFITIGGRDRFAVVPVDKYVAVQAGAMRAERELAEAQERAAQAEQRAVEAERQLQRALVAAEEAAHDAKGFRTMASSEVGALGNIAELSEEKQASGAVGEPPSQDDAPSDASAAAVGGAVGSVPYEVAVLPNTPIDSDDYQRSMWHDAILDRMRKVMAAEAPIERQRLFNTVRASFGIKRSGRDIQSHNEWLFNRSIEHRTTEFNGSTFVWLPDQDPATYDLLRVVSEDSGRQITEVPYEELACAMAAALAGGKALSRDELIEATMRSLGYKRKTTRVREVIGAALERAADERVVRLFSDGTFRAGN